MCGDSGRQKKRLATSSSARASWDFPNRRGERERADGKKEPNKATDENFIKLLRTLVTQNFHPKNLFVMENIIKKSLWLINN